MLLYFRHFISFFFFLSCLFSLGCSSFQSNLQKLKSESSADRCEAIHWLYFNVQTDTSEKLVMDALEKDQNMTVRSLAARIMGIHGKKDFIPRLEKALYDPSFLVRMEAVQSLGSLQSQGSLPKLTELLGKETDPYVKLKVLKTIQYMKADAAVPSLIEALEDSEPAVRFQSLLLLEKFTQKKLGTEKEAWKKWLDSQKKTAG